MTSTCVHFLSPAVNLTTCLENGVCRALNATFSYCACNTDKTGTSCEFTVPNLVGVLVFDGLFYFSVFFVWVFLAIRRYRKTGGEDFEHALMRGVTPSHPSIFGLRILILYRFVVFGFTFGVHIFTLVGDVAEYRFYTIWNFITLVTYFALGLGLSLVRYFKGEDGILGSKYWRFNAKLHYIFLEIELPNALIVDIVVWAILFPPCPAPCSLIAFPSFVEHLSNSFLMSIDFLLASHAFDVNHWFFILAMPSSYAIFSLFWAVADQPPVYFFMDATDPFQPAWIIGVLLIHIFVFFLVWAVSRYVVRRKLPALDEKSDTKSLVTHDSMAVAAEADQKFADAENPQFDS